MMSKKNQNSTECLLQAKSLLLISFLLLFGVAGCGTPTAHHADRVSLGSSDTAQTSSTPAAPLSSSSGAYTPVTETRPVAPLFASNLIGTWRASVWYKGRPRVWVYTFNDDGNLEHMSLNKQGRVVHVGGGKYTYSNGKVVINWRSGFEEEAITTWGSSDSFEYQITSHSDGKQIGILTEFHRFTPGAFPSVSSSKQQPAPNPDESTAVRDKLMKFNDEQRRIDATMRYIEGLSNIYRPR